MKIPRVCPKCHAPVNIYSLSDAVDVPYDSRLDGIGPLDPGTFGFRFCPFCGESLFAECAACGGTGYRLMRRPALYCIECGTEIRVEGQVKVTCRTCSGRGGSWMTILTHRCAGNLK